MTNKLARHEWQRDHNGWNQLKQQLDKTRQLPKFSERDIWFLSIGANVGSEIDGKHNQYERPVLVLKKFSETLFFGLPMTSKRKRGNWFYTLTINGRLSVVVLDQGRVFSPKRLVRKMSYRVSADDFTRIQRQLKRILF